MSKLTNIQSTEIIRQSDVISKNLRDNFTNHKNAINDTDTRVDNLIIASGTSDAETIDARDNFALLKDNIQARRLYKDVVQYNGLDVSAQGTPDDTIQVSAGIAIVNGIGLELLSTVNSPSISSSAAGNHRIVVIVIETDNTIDVVESSEVLTSIIATYPTIADTQKALAYVLIDDTAVVINNSDITDLRFKGATVNGKQFFSPQTAINALDNTVGGDIVIGSGDYIGELMDITGKNNIRISIDTGAKFYRATATDIILKSINIVSNETSNISIIGGDFFGNGLAGSVSLVDIQFTDNFRWINTFMDGNASSSAVFKNYIIDECDNFMIQGLSSSVLDFNITNSLNWTSQTDNDFVQDNFSLQDMAEILSRNSNF